MRIGTYYKMKVILTIDQLKRLLETEPLHLPIIISMDKVSKKEFQELTVLLKKKRKG